MTKEQLEEKNAELEAKLLEAEKALEEKNAELPLAEKDENSVEVAFLVRDEKGFPKSYEMREVPKELAEKQLSMSNHDPEKSSHWHDAVWPENMKTL